MLDVVWGIFDQDGDGTLTKAEFMDVSARPLLSARALQARVVFVMVRGRCSRRARRGGEAGGTGRD